MCIFLCLFKKNFANECIFDSIVGVNDSGTVNDSNVQMGSNGMDPEREPKVEAVTVDAKEGYLVDTSESGDSFEAMSSPEWNKRMRLLLGKDLK